MQRYLTHVLLSLLLLLSQQVGLLHGISHAASLDRSPLAAEVVDAGTTDGSRQPKVALFDLCAQCAASAQVAFALPSVVRLFLPVELAFSLLPAPRTPTLCLLTRCVFLSRAPPSA